MTAPIPTRTLPRILVLAAVAMASGCDTKTETSPAGSYDALYFASPESAVIRATALLREQDWAMLARYYDLAGTPFTRDELASGSFFFSDRIEGLHHPASLSRYKHPFAPGFRLLRIEPGGTSDVLKMVMMVEIDQGAGMTQRGTSAFLLRRHPQGWQFLPAHVDP
jgi:hypothetical protein